ncbi:hypothetical protein XA68_14717 [Ophiocordyceps unilateralis]|uniref:Chromatin associated protein KTI12 n=1 Tax=Ophiocordyceps unilateralis TaxID=268505 RepID=A0A2A9PMY0_OPHUN|nr:hypothetical protein XA68_14717 [Ophiocordyceps unilateralis]
MPLIVVTGFPTSGKSTRAQQLYDYLAERLADSKQWRLHLVSDDSLSISRSVYHLSPASLPAHTRSANASEKDARAAVYGAVKRVLSDRDFVILDGLNYIKGWRYQLHCEAKAARTPSCVLQVGCSVDAARSVNQQRLQRGDDNAYEPANWDNLVFRYEEPNAMARWDSPLFTLIWDDDASRTRDTFNALWEAVAGDGRPVVRPNQATAPRGRDADGDYLYVLERETQDVVKRILDQQANGGDVKVPSTTVGDG